MGEAPIEELRRRYQIDPIDVDPTVNYRLTDNWLELTVRFLTPDHGVRRIKDAVSREIIAALDEAKIGIASGTYAIVQMPPLEITAVPQLTLRTQLSPLDDAKSKENNENARSR